MSQKAKDIAIIIGEVGLLAALAGLFALAYAGKIDGSALSSEILPVVGTVVAAVLAYLFRGQLAQQQIQAQRVEMQSKVDTLEARAQVLAVENQQLQVMAHNAGLNPSAARLNPPPPPPRIPVEGK